MALCSPLMLEGLSPVLLQTTSSLRLKASFSRKSFLTLSQNLPFSLCVSLAQIGWYTPSTGISFCPICWCFL